MINRTRITAFLVLTVFGLAILGLSGGLYIKSLSESSSERLTVLNDVNKCPSNYTKYKAGVVTNGIECSKIGADILRKDGSAADATIAALFCEGVAMSQSMGLGGGFLLTIYTKKTGVVETLDARETAPLAATRDMYHGDRTLSQRGVKSIAVPGDLKGYWELYQKYGKLSWKELIEPTIKLCRKGIYVTKYLANAFKSQEERIQKESSMREIFIDPATNQTWAEGTRLRRPKLAETLEIIANEGGDALYNGSLTKQFVNDIVKKGGIISEDDMRSYRAVWNASVQSKLMHNNSLHTVPLPGSGVILSFMMNILDGFLDMTEFSTTRNWQRIVESFKFGYGRRTELGDPSFVPGIYNLLANLTSKSYAEEIRKLIFDNKTSQDPGYYGANVSVPEDHGTAHICVLAANGDAVSVTSTINLVLGSVVRSESTGIILNDEMDDFSAPNITNAFGIPPSPANFIEPGKRPLSSMSPSILLDGNGNVRLVIGAAGGSKITTQIALVILKNMYFNKSLNESIAEKRLHHQLFPMAIQYEHDFDERIIDELHKIGHKYEYIDSKDGFAAITAISKECDTVFGQFDYRRQGSVTLL